MNAGTVPPNAAQERLWFFAKAVLGAAAFSALLYGLSALIAYWATNNAADALVLDRLMILGISMMFLGALLTWVLIARRALHSRSEKLTLALLLLIVSVLLNVVLEAKEADIDEFREALSGSVAFISMGMSYSKHIISFGFAAIAAGIVSSYIWDGARP